MRTLVCPVDVRAIRKYMETDDATQRPTDKRGRQVIQGKTYKQIAEDFLKRVDNNSNSTGSVEIRYRYSDLGADLRAAGLVCTTREYAMGEDWHKDPFNLPRPLRTAAMARFGYDFDDAAAHPRAQLECVPTGRDEMAKLLKSSDQREEIMRKSAAIIFPHDVGAEWKTSEARKKIKAAFASFSMDGTWDDLVGRVYKDTPPPIATPDLVWFNLDAGGHFNLQEYLRAQEQGTEWLSRRMETHLGMLTYIEEWHQEYRKVDEDARKRAIVAANAAAGVQINPQHIRPTKQRHANRTLKSYVFQNFESISRDAKVRWATANGHAAISSQHDGVVIALTEGADAEEVRSQLERASEEELGYEQPCEIKAMTSGDEPQTRERTDDELEMRVIGTKYTPTRKDPAKNAISSSFNATAPQKHVTWLDDRETVFSGSPEDCHQGKGYEMIHTRELQEDPVLRLFLREKSMEVGQASCCTSTGRIAQFDREERAVLTGGRKSMHETKNTLKVAMTLHAAHQFTHAAATDGSKARATGSARDDTEREAHVEDHLAPTAYGIWEGVRPYGTRSEDGTVRSNDKTDRQAVGRGMSGGKLPNSCEVIDAELYAVYKFLSKVWKEQGTEAKRRNTRVLLMVDSQSACSQIETAWRHERSAGSRIKDRGALIEAICNIRADLDRVIVMWVPAHSGCAPNSYADLAAKTHLTGAAIEDTTREIADQCETRPCLYERRILDEASGERYELADAKPYPEARKRARAYVRTRLAETTSTGATRAGTDGPLWTEVVKRTMKACDPHDARAAKARNGEPARIEDIVQYNERTATVLGMRVDNIVGVSHGRSWRKRYGAEKGGVGPATASRQWGCWACKVARDKERREAAAAHRHQNKRTRRTAADGTRDWEEEDAEQRNSLATTRHVHDGSCYANQDLWKEASARHEYTLRLACGACETEERGHAYKVNTKARTMLQSAKEAAEAIKRGERIDEEQWRNRFAVLAAMLPEWEEGNAKSKTVEACAAAVVSGQDTATEATAAWKKAAQKGIAFENNRRKEAGLLHLTLRLWREQIEKEAPGICNDNSRWVIRTKKQGRAMRPRRATNHSPSASEVFVNERKLNFQREVTDNYTWSPWFPTNPRGQTEPEDEATSMGQEETTEEEQAQWRAWQLRDRCLRVATYYRVQHMQSRAARRERRLRVQVALRAWAKQTLETTRQQQHREAGKRARDPITYKETPTRKQRATPEEMIIRANRKRTRIQTTTAAETGRRLMAMVTETAERVKRQRMMETRKRLRIDEAEAG